MRQNNLFLRGKTLVLPALCIGIMTLASCADVYDGDETYSSDVRNATMVSPDAENITITASTDGSQQTIAWPVVYGAGGYELIVTDVTDSENPVELLNEIVDGCSVTMAREEDKNYRLTLRTLGDAELNNKDSETSTAVSFTTFLPAFATIPAGADLVEYFAANPAPESAATEMVYYDLESNGNYTLNGTLELTNKKVALRTASANKATIVYGAEGKITTYAGFVLKNLNIDCSAQTSSSSSIIQLSETPDESIKGIQTEGSYKSSYYDIQDNIVLQGLNVKGLPGFIFFDGNKVAYGLRALIVKDCVIELATSSEHSLKENALINSYKGYINEFTMSNTTVWTSSAATGEAKFMLRYSNSGRPDRYGYSKASVTFSNNTFYNVCNKGQWANYDGIGNTHKWAAFKMTGCIFVDCGNNQVARRFIRNKPASGDDITFQNNTYMFNNEFEENSEYDTSGTQITSDPQFKNSAVGDFTVGGADQLAKRTGDPRWLPEVETE